VVETFAIRACELMEVDGVGPVPTLAFSDVEADRALEIAQQILDTGLRALSQPPVKTEASDAPRRAIGHQWAPTGVGPGVMQHPAGGRRSRSSRYAGCYSMGGTGLEPVTSCL
jgi:hypothetical protein